MRFASTKKAGRALLALALLTQGFFFGAVAVPPAQAQKAVGYKGTPGTATSATVDVSSIALEDDLAPDASNNEPRVIHRPMSPPTEGQLLASMGRGGTISRQSALSVPNAEAPGAPLIPSPAPSTNFLGLTDNQQFIPPDTMGAVSERWVVTILNDRMRIQDRAGNVISTVSTNSFWQPLTYALAQPFDTFDPKVYYDRFTSRFIFVMTANARTATSSILLAVSQTDNPAGAWNLYGVDVDSTNINWADYPSVGFNQNWIVVQVNMFTVAANAFTRPDIYVFNKAQVINSTTPGTPASFTKFTGVNTGAPPAITGSTWAPSIDADNVSPGKLWFVQTWNSTSGLVRVSTLTGSVGSEVLTPGTQFPQSPESWFSGQVLLNSGWAPQANDTKTAPFSTYVSANDSRMQNVVYRRINGLDRLWSTHTVFEPNIHQPAGTNPNSLANPVNHSAVQWWQLDATLEPGAFTTAPIQRSIIEDLTAKNCHNGAGGLIAAASCTPSGTFYAFPNIAVNNTDDALIGLARYNALDWVAAAYVYREHTDPLNTFRDPTIYKMTTLAEGSGRYSKSGNGDVRWGDYSEAQIDPRNDHHFWTIQEYAAPRINAGGTSVWSTWWTQVLATTPPPTLPGQLLISEFRESGPAGNLDEFIEVYNGSLDPITVSSIDIAGTGYAIVTSDGVTRCVIPNGTVIPAEGHFLCTNSSVGGYSLGGYPAGNGSTATPNSTYTADIPDNMGIALFRTTLGVNFNTANRLDAVGSASEPNPLYKEGTGYPDITAGFTAEGSWKRIQSKKDGRVFDANDNATDFYFADTQATNANGRPLLGAPGPENLSSPLFKGNDTLVPSMVAPCVSSTTAPNRVRTGSPGGFLDIRRRFTNNTGAPVTRLRFRVIDITTLPQPSASTADLRAVTSIDSSEANPCGGGSLTIRGTTLEEPPSQPNGGGFNSSLTIPSTVISVGTPLAPGDSIDVTYHLQVVAGGSYRFWVAVEALP
ncbi:MAG: lamin tail domain-containing protein [Pyrinomonadaceae bacterium]